MWPFIQYRGVFKRLPIRRRYIRCMTYVVNICVADIGRNIYALWVYMIAYTTSSQYSGIKYVFAIQIKWKLLYLRNGKTATKIDDIIGMLLLVITNGNISSKHNPKFIHKQWKVEKGKIYFLDKSVEIPKRDAKWMKFQRNKHAKW